METDDNNVNEIQFLKEQLHLLGEQLKLAQQANWEHLGKYWRLQDEIKELRREVYRLKQGEKD